MKKNVLKDGALAGVAICLFTGAIALSFQDTPYVNAILDNHQSFNDTAKKSRAPMTRKELDEVSEELGKTLLQATKEISNIDMEKIRQEVQQALKGINIDQIIKETEMALEKIDREKILTEVKTELNKVDKAQFNANEIHTALTNVDKELAKTMKEIDRIDKQAIKENMNSVYKEIAKASTDLKNIDMDKINTEVQESIAKATLELADTKSMFNQMEKEGLIDQAKGFSIRYEERRKELYINGIKQEEKITGKYRKYFRGKNVNITIEKEK